MISGEHLLWDAHMHAAPARAALSAFASRVTVSLGVRSAEMFAALRRAQAAFARIEASRADAERALQKLAGVPSGDTPRKQHAPRTPPATENHGA